MYSFQKKLYFSCYIHIRKISIRSKKYLRSRKLEKLKDRKISMIVGTRTVANLAWSRLRGGNKEEGNARDLVARKTGGQLLPSGFIGNKYF